MRRPHRARSAASLLLASLLLACGDAGERLDAARTLLAAGRYGEAVPALRAALAADPEDAEAHHLLGLAYAQLGQSRRATAAPPAMSASSEPRRSDGPSR